MDAEARMAALEAEIRRLREIVANYENALGADFGPHVALGLTATEARLVGLLVKHGSVTKDRIMSALYGLRSDVEEPDIKIVDVLVCKARRKLAGFGIKIGTIWGQGYSMDEASRARCRDICGAQAYPRPQFQPDNPCSSAAQARR